MYRITYEQGNGYSCNCCRRTGTESEDFDTPEEVQHWVNTLKASQTISVWEDESDREIESIEKEIGVDISDQFKPQEDEVEKIITIRKKNKEEEKRVADVERLKIKEEKDLEEYKRLQNKFKK